MLCLCEERRTADADNANNQNNPYEPKLYIPVQSQSIQL